MENEKQPLLSLHKLTKIYGSLAANDSIDLDVFSGSIHAILGENGAGKSTLMKLAYGVETPDGGDIFWNGQKITNWNPAIARSLGIGMVFQHFSLFETLSVVENIALTIEGSRQDLIERIRKIGADYQLEIDPTAMVNSLSVGQRQRVEIIRCLMQDLKLLILDEPTSVLPPQHVRTLFDALRKLQNDGVAILYISHKLEEIRELCDVATILRDGKVTGIVDPNQCTAQELATLMIGRSIPKIDRHESHNKTKSPVLEIRKLDLRTDLDPKSIEMFGQSVTDKGVIERRDLGFSFVPEERLGRGAVPSMSLAQNSLLTAFKKGMLRNGFIQNDRVAEYTDKCITEFSVKASGHSASANSLSGGNLQKFLVGRELRLQPKLLFLSQPTWGVDVGSANEIRLKLISLRDAGVGILVISEELEELFEITDRMYVLRSGRMSPSIKTSDVSPDEIGEYMIGEKREELDDAVSV
ncbi:MAG: ABC transporter ATP-binding protein [Rhodobacteraceae bacterium]|nr:ABC transporter ATP-binding protein [Paracoccaceae bacterium]